MGADIEAYGHQFPAYRDNPIAETLRAVAGMSGDPGFARRYTSFLRDMVYGDKPDFNTAMGTLNTLADHLKKVPA